MGMVRITHRSRGEGQGEEASDEIDLRIAEMIITGKSNKEIARHLAMPEGTVKSRVHRLYKRVAVSSRAQFVRRVLQSGENFRSSM